MRLLPVTARIQCAVHLELRARFALEIFEQYDPLF
jgi:hypothetical protein